MNDQRNFEIPKEILKEFLKEPRIVMFYRPDGLWPVPIDILRRSEYFNNLFENPEFAKKYQVVIMPRQPVR